MEIRAVLETWGASAAAANATTEEIESMTACLEAMSRARNAGRIGHELNVRLHFLISSASRNRFLVHIMVTISAWIERVTRKVYAASSDERAIQDQLLAQHTAIVDAIRSGDSPAASRAMARHLRYAEETVRRTGPPPASPETDPS
ncbi:MAG: FadR family transcriptional regulator [Desulfosarcina sp.]|nr:FadR family transcriptional regulator [Desulfobacterales bacterium]